MAYILKFDVYLCKILQDFAVPRSGKCCNVVSSRTIIQSRVLMNEIVNCIHLFPHIERTFS